MDGMYDNINISDKELEELSEHGRYWLMCNGGILRHSANNGLFYPFPFTLFPSPMPKNLYEEVVELQKDFQFLSHKASLDHEFIKESLKSVIVNDDFTKRLYDIYDQVRQAGLRPKLYYLMVRSDYMVDEFKKSNYRIRQIEVNLIAAGMGNLSRILSDMHSYVKDMVGDRAPFNKARIADGNDTTNLGLGMAKAFQLYGNEDAVVVVVSQEVELNRGDHTHIMQTFHDGAKKIGLKKHVSVLFRTIRQLYDGHVTSDNKFMMEGREVAIFYFRSGYRPGNFPTEQHWEARLKIEQSMAVKIPTAAEQLIGTKKVQQVFAAPGVIEKYIKDPDRVKRMRDTFAELYSLDAGKEGDEAQKIALAEPHRYVLKPQREGGGNNLFDEEMVAELQRITDPVERSQYILMERIRPPVIKNYMVQYNTEVPTLVDTVTEYGIFGVYLSDGETEYMNESAGYLARTKSVDNKEGGVTCGSAVIDAPYLV